MALVVLICLAFLFLLLESKNVILKLRKLSQHLHQATLANASEITRSAFVQEMKYTISPQFSTVTLVLQSSLAACGTCEYCLMLSHLEGKLAHSYIKVGLKVVSLGFFIYMVSLCFFVLYL